MKKDSLRVLNPRESTVERSPREQRQEACEAFWQQKLQSSAITVWDKLRFLRTLELLKKHSDLSGKECIDLGCGEGSFLRLLRTEGALVTGLDLSETALGLCRNVDTINIKLIHDYLPRTRLEDSSFDVVACLDLIAHLEERDYRLCISEWARLIRREGYLVCSTPLDIGSEDALERFVGLVQTEFLILDSMVSYNRLFNKISWFSKSPRILKMLESCTRFLYQERGIDHIILIGQRRPL